MNKLQRRIWVASVGLVAFLIVLAGLAVGAFRLAVQLVPEYRADVAQRVEALIGSPVQIDHMDLLWRGRFPTLQLRGVEIGAQAQNRLGLDELTLGFAVTRLLRGDVTPGRIGLHGTRLQLIREQGQFRLGGLNPQGEADQSPQDILDRLKRIGQVHWRDAQLRWIDRDAGRPPRDIVIESLDSDSRRAGMSLQAQLHLVGQDNSTLQLEAELDTTPWQLVSLQLGADNWSPWQELRAYLNEFPAIEGRVQRLDLDAQWQDGQWQSAQLEYDLRALRPGAGEESVELLVGTAQLDRQAGQGLRASLQVQTLETTQASWPEQNILIDWQPAQDSAPAQYGVTLEYLRLQDLQAWARLLPARIADTVRALMPQGELRELVVQSAGAQRLPQLTGEFSGLSLQPHQQIPGVTNLSGLLTFSDAAGRVQLDSQAMSLDAPKIFDRVLQLQELSGAISWQRSSDGWQVDAPGLHYAGMNLDGVGRLHLELGSQTRMDLDLNFFCSDPRPWLAYQPVTWSQDLRDWLSSAIGPARVAAGQVRINGPMDQFPFADGQGGEFVVDLDLQDATLKFAPDWPQVEVAQARLLIDGTRLRVDAAQAAIGGVVAQSAQAEIADLKQSELAIDASLQGNAKPVWHMLSQSGLRKNLGELFDSLDVSGPVVGDLRLNLPLNQLDNTRFAVDIELDKAALWTRYWPDPVQKIRGRIHIDEKGLRGRDVSAAVAGIPVTVDLTPDQGKTSIAARFSASPAELPSSVPVPEWLKRRAQGRSDYRLDLEVGDGANPQVTVHSPMLGTALDLPRPFGKRAEQLRALDVRISPASNTRVHVTYGEHLGLDMLLADQARGLRAARLKLGGDVPPAGAPGWWVEGALERADFERWLPLIQDMVEEIASTATTAKPDEGFGGLVVKLDEFHALGQRLPDTRLQLTQGQDDWRLGLSGPRASGILYLSERAGSDRLQVRGEFDNMNWTRAIEVDVGEAIDPNSIPALNVAVKNFALNDVALGQFRLKLEPVQRGLRISQATIDTEQRRELDLSGLWLRDEQGSSAAMDFSMDTESFSSWLTVLGYQDNLVAKRGKLNGQLNWAPDPQGLEFASLNGHLEFDFSDGQLLNIEPGAGRVLGLFSVNALPRRFFLDFSDVVNTGLGFDELSGRFDLNAGIANTQNLQVKGPSLRIGVRGNVDLVKREYDQVVTIYPGISSGVSLAATVLGGPVVGLVTLLAQELLDQPLDQVTQIGYHLGGSWDNPKVSRLQ